MISSALGIYASRQPQPSSVDPISDSSSESDEEPGSSIPARPWSFSRPPQQFVKLRTAEEDKIRELTAEIQSLRAAHSEALIKQTNEHASAIAALTRRFQADLRVERQEASSSKLLLEAKAESEIEERLEAAFMILDERWNTRDREVEAERTDNQRRIAIERDSLDQERASVESQGREVAEAHERLSTAQANLDQSLSLHRAEREKSKADHAAQLSRLELTTATRLKKHFVLDLVSQYILHVAEQTRLNAITYSERSIADSQSRETASRLRADTMIAEADAKAAVIVQEARSKADFALQEATSRSSSIIHEAESQADSITKKANARAATIIEAAETEAGSKISAAKSTATSTVEDAKSTAASSLRAAEDEAASIRETAQRKASAIIDDATARATSIVEEAQVKASLITEEAREQKDDLAAQANQQRDDILVEARRQKDEILAEAHAQETSLIFEARKQRDHLISESERQRDQILLKAHHQGEDLLAEARTRQSDIVSSAEKQSQEVRAEADKQSAKILASAKCSSDEIIASANQKSQEIVAEAEALAQSQPRRPPRLSLLSPARSDSQSRDDYQPHSPTLSETSLSTSFSVKSFESLPVFGTDWQEKTEARLKKRGTLQDASLLKLAIEDSKSLAGDSRSPSKRPRHKPRSTSHQLQLSSTILEEPTQSEITRKRTTSETVPKPFRPYPVARPRFRDGGTDPS
ncbi:hypothetical protein SISNIDRAFT_454089 [Sistotremastrum niveocremeum HHB9708]|uniref:Uncharacterized protein n=1 Tax=Sistotremastrum niveocremeum HHB9708 TaxID=1314777 RepID=A0A164UYY9_9AGAM|nr:hypothetical protein SISNIDRAFT_454089 [Sistotremastrum niveocremeum HHB9708]